MNKTTISLNQKKLIIYKPDTCTYCNKGIDPMIVNRFAYSFHDIPTVIITFKCPCCDEVFFTKYYITPMLDSGLYPFETIGGNKRRLDFCQEIKDLSPGFVENYNDAFVAEQSGCTSILGIAYRRAFEFLIKDYAIKFYPSDIESIKKMNLSSCVEKYMKDKDTKELLKRTIWIGNDFAHYENKHEEVDINDLKQLIELSAKEIESEIKKKNYISNIKSNK